MNTKQARQILLLKEDPTYEEIRYAYRKLALELHPDKNEKESDGKKFKLITEAYYFLKIQYNSSNSHNRKSSTKYQENENPSDQKKNFYRENERFRKDKTPEEDWSRFTKEFEEDKDWWKKYEQDFWNKYESSRKDDVHKQETSNVKQKPEVDLSVKVDPSLCIGCCSCETIAPNVFTVDKTTTMNPKSRVYNSKGAKNLKIINAAETCPTKAIIVDDLENNQRIFPY